MDHLVFMLVHRLANKPCISVLPSMQLILTADPFDQRARTALLAEVERAVDLVACSASSKEPKLRRRSAKGLPLAQCKANPCHGKIKVYQASTPKPGKETAAYPALYWVLITATRIYMKFQQTLHSPDAAELSAS